jgi:hypothetical protein
MLLPFGELPLREEAFGNQKLKQRMNSVFYVIKVHSASEGTSGN